MFTGTRVPVQALFDYLEGGDTLGDFLNSFPDVTQAQAIEVLEKLKAQALGEPACVS